MGEVADVVRGLEIADEDENSGGVGEDAREVSFDEGRESSSSCIVVLAED